jgi:hypothetical protein
MTGLRWRVLQENQFSFAASVFDVSGFTTIDDFLSELDQIHRNDWFVNDAGDSQFLGFGQKYRRTVAGEKHDGDGGKTFDETQLPDDIETADGGHMIVQDDDIQLIRVLLDDLDGFQTVVRGIGSVTGQIETQPEQVACFESVIYK